MSYNDTTGVISEPISTNDIATALNHNSDSLLELCRSDKVNWKSKYKPVENPNVKANITDAQRKEVNWGYDFPEEPVGLDKFRDYVLNGTVPSLWVPGDTDNLRTIGFGWYYRKPSTYKRKRDFNKYNSKTTAAFFSEIDAPSEVKSDTASMYIELYKGTFWLDDFRTFVENNCHLGVMIVKQGSSTAYYKSVIAESGNTYQKITFNQTEVSQIFSGGVGTYNVYVFATANSNHNTLRGDQYYNATLSGIGVWPLPVEGTTITYSSGTSESDAYIRRIDVAVDDLESTDRNLYFNLTAVNEYNTAKNVAYVWYEVLGTDEAYTDREIVSVRLLGVRTVSVPAMNSVVLTKMDGTTPFTVPYTGYKDLLTPFTVTLNVYHSSNAEGTDRRFAGRAQFTYE